MGTCSSRESDNVAHTFSLWKLATTKALRQRDKDQFSLRLAELHQQIADNEATVANAVRMLCSSRSGSPLDNETCVVCLKDAIRMSSVHCDDGHCVCFDCIHLINISAVRKRHCDSILCPSPTECDCSINLSNLCKTPSGRDVLREQQHQKTVSTVIDLLANHTIEAVLLKLQYMRHDGTYAAYECPECHFGPLEHMYCDDLLEWHKRNGNKNNCPRCGNMVTTVQKLIEWSGQ